MPSMQLRRDDVIVGVYTHKDEHVAVVLDGLGGRLGEKFIPATAAGFADLLTFCHDQVGVKGRLTGFGVEGTGSYGMGLARFLRRIGHTVHEVHRPPRKGERRMSGKSDTIDAEHAARQVLGGSIMAVPKTADGQIEALRPLKIARDTAVKAQTTAMITLKATLVTASDQLRAELEPLTDHKLILACAASRFTVGLGRSVAMADLHHGRFDLASAAGRATYPAWCRTPLGGRPDRQRPYPVASGSDRLWAAGAAPARLAAALVVLAPRRQATPRLPPAHT
jgi:Transposase